MSGYWQASVVIDGAVDQEDELTDRQFNKLQTEITGWAETHPDTPVEVFGLWHEHRRGVDCECAQYATDHRPVLSFNN